MLSWGKSWDFRSVRQLFFRYFKDILEILDISEILKCLGSYVAYEIVFIISYRCCCFYPSKRKKRKPVRQQWNWVYCPEWVNILRPNPFAPVCVLTDLPNCAHLPPTCACWSLVRACKHAHPTRRSLGHEICCVRQAVADFLWISFHLSLFSFCRLLWLGDLVCLTHAGWVILLLGFCLVIAQPKL